MPLKTADIISQLQTDILRLQGFKSSSNTGVELGLGPMRDAFPNGSFPLGAVHEFLTARMEDGAATSGFISGLLSTMMGNGEISIWISSTRTLFPPALKNFGIEPHQFLFLDLQREDDVLWAMEEALKCNALAAVVGEVNEITFTESRRLQLAVERSQVTGFILRPYPRKLNPTACVSRWKIHTLPSEPVDDLPGIGFPQWRAEILRIRNGRPGVWDIRWAKGTFEPVFKSPSTFTEQKQKTG